MGTIALVVLQVKGRSLVPSPPTKMTAFMFFFPCIWTSLYAASLFTVNTPACHLQILVAQAKSGQVFIKY
jgi:hypothetical protein